MYVPKLDREIACIASDDFDLEIIATVLYELSKDNMYCPFFEMPRIKYKQNHNSTSQDDDYLANIIAHVKSTHINNAMARLHTKIIICIGLDDIQLSYFKLDQYFNVQKIYINNLEDVYSKLHFINPKKKQYNEFRNMLNDPSLALYNGIINNYSTDTNSVLIVAEKSNDISDLIVANYAASIRADIKYISAVSRRDVDLFYDDLLNWKLNKSYGAYLKTNEFINEQIKETKISSYEFVTFFTTGIPYGIFFNDASCCSHVIIPLNEDIFIFNNLIYEMDGNKYDTAIIFSPEPDDLGKVTSIESNIVNEALTKRNFYTKKLYNKQATVTAFDQYIGYYPFDILHIVTHGGEVSGYYVNTSFTDRVGQIHSIEFEEIVGFAFNNTNFVNVASKRIFRYLDGYRWMSPELKAAGYPEYVFTDMLKSISNDDSIPDTCRVKVDYLIEKSCHIQCYDGIHQGQFQSIASNGNPFIFNNSCISWREFSANLIASGCRGYIGTLWNINNRVALDSSSLFYSTAIDRTICESINTVLKSINNEDYDGIYVYCGLHFSTIKSSSYHGPNKVVKELAESLIKWNTYILKPIQSFQVESALGTIKFLCKELSLFYKEVGVVEIIAKSLRLCTLIEKREEQRKNDK